MALLSTVPNPAADAPYGASSATAIGVLSEESSKHPRTPTPEQRAESDRTNQRRAFYAIRLGHRAKDLAAAARRLTPKIAELFT